MHSKGVFMFTSEKVHTNLTVADQVTAAKLKNGDLWYYADGAVKTMAAGIFVFVHADAGSLYYQPNLPNSALVSTSLANKTSGVIMKFDPSLIPVTLYRAIIK